jgi:two-component system, cell cycle sensor histidine kinase and response regulator CckA
MTRAPTLDEIFDVMHAASGGDGTARVTLPDEADLADPATRFAIALNLLLDDLAFRVVERQQAEERLRQSQKLEALGRLAGGVAHDFNNLLSVILGFTELAASDPDAPAGVRADLDEVKRAGERARDLTRQLLAFSRHQVLEPKVLDLNAVLTGMESMLRRLLGESVELSFRTFGSLEKVKVDQSQLEQVIMNLAVNAKDAMAGGGRLSFETASVELDAEYARQHPDVTPGPYVLLSVTDTGVGMDASVRARVFEPFFTTKEQGRGTGLGLATTFGIVRQTGGHIGVRSEPGRGSTFEIYFPPAEQPPDAAPVRPEASARGGTETVLLVEDEAQVRGLVRLVLRRAGYDVLEAPGPGEAILIVEQSPAPIHLMLTDIVMPRMSGVDLAARLRPQRPGMRVLYMSGYTETPLRLEEATHARFLQKPFTPGALLEAVRDTLDAE